MNASFVTHGLDRAHSTSAAGNVHGLWNRLRKAAFDFRLDRSEREVARFLQENGGRLTDDLERRILDRISGLDQGGFH
jgi:hypothetical protein